MAHKVVILGYSYSRHTSRWARAIRDEGYDVTVISCSGQPIDGVETIIYGKGPGSAGDYFRYLQRVQIRLRQLKPDLIHAFQATGYGHWGAIRGLCPKLLTALGSDIMITARKSLWHRWYVGSIVKKYDRFTSPSIFLRNTMEAIYPAVRGRIEVVTFGVEVPDRYKEHHAVTPVRLVYMKLLRSIYGPDVLLHALVQLKADRVPVRLDMYGYGRETAGLKKLTKKLGLESVVTFQGWIDQEQVMARYLDCDIMVMPSRSESFGVAAAEASAAGLPVVATAVGGVPEVVLDGETGLLVPPEDPHRLADAIRRLAEDVDMRRKFGEAGREYVSEHLQWDKSVKQMMNLYRELLDGGEKG
ncbi:MAG: glycosyltransferase family 4 protein [Candidatus Zixiibacteriota bacterium]|nr:MAG: glycosyltransferase family 4 protein [candidate division Zixibacteria bacterium]